MLKKGSFLSFCLILACQIAWLLPVSGQQVLPARGQQVLPKLNHRDSLAKANRLKFRHLDSLKRSMRRDSLRAGMPVHIKGKEYHINTPEGRRLQDSLSNPSRFRKQVALKIAALKLAASKLAASKLAASKLADSNLTDSNLTDSNRTASKLAASKLAASKLAASKLAASKLAASKLTSSKGDSSNRSSIKNTKTDSSTNSDSSKKIRSSALIKQENFIPFFVQYPHNRNKAQLQRLQTEGWIARNYNLNQVKKTLLVFKPTEVVAEEKIKGRPFVRHGSVREVRPLWIIFVLLLIVLIITIVKTRYPRDLQEIFESLFSDRIIRSNRDAGIIYSPSFIFMFVGFCLVAALMIYDYLTYQKFDLNYADFSLYSLICAGVFGFFAFKLVIYRASIAVFDIDRFLKPYLAFLYIVLANFTVAGLPFLIFYSFYTAAIMQHLVVWIPFIFVFFFTFLYLRSVVYSITNFQFQKFYLFLYFCTFEICPLIIVFKLING